MSKKIYTDGACKNNPGKGGWAFIVLDKDDNKTDEGVGSSKMSTNNKMEMQAVIEGLKKTSPGETVGIYSDSAYVVNCFKSDWITGWKKKGWKNSKREPVKNKELWQEMDALVMERDISFIKVKAHQIEGSEHYDKFNDEVDVMADHAARNA